MSKTIVGLLCSILIAVAACTSPGSEKGCVDCPQLAATSLFYTFTHGDSLEISGLVNREILVDGVVEYIEHDIRGMQYVILKGDSMLGDVQCYFVQEIPASQIKSGDKITIQGMCRGKMLNVLLDSCILLAPR